MFSARRKAAFPPAGSVHLFISHTVTTMNTMSSRPIRIWSRLPRLIYPPRCVICDRLLPKEAERDGLCACCENSLPSTDSGSFSVLERSLSLCLSPFYYQDDMKQSIRRFKFCGRAHYHKVYGMLLREYLKEFSLTPPDVVTWAPLSRLRLYRRGYDQSRLLAEEAAQLYGLFPRRLLVKRRNTRPQSSLSAEARHENVKGVYRLYGAAELAGKRVLLVDDIVTTGATLDACAELLLNAGAAEVTCLTLARSRSVENDLS